MDDRAAIAELYRMLTAALERADALNLILVGTRIEEARMLLASQQGSSKP